MKGVVFTEFFDMVEDVFGYEMVDDLLNETDLPSGGIYTAVGTYAHQEMVQLVLKLSEKSQTGVDVLLKTFGKHLFGRFVENYAHFFSECKDAFSFLGAIEDHIHVEVRKLYPDAELPTFHTKLSDDGKELKMTYYSDRSMGDLAEGLIESTLSYYEEEASLARVDKEDSGKVVEFTITKHQNGGTQPMETEVGAGASR